MKHRCNELAFDLIRNYMQPEHSTLLCTLCNYRSGKRSEMLGTREVLKEEKLLMKSPAAHMHTGAHNVAVDTIVDEASVDRIPELIHTVEGESKACAMYCCKPFRRHDECARSFSFSESTVAAAVDGGQECGGH